MALSLGAPFDCLDPSPRLALYSPEAHTVRHSAVPAPLPARQGYRCRNAGLCQTSKLTSGNCRTMRIGEVVKRRQRGRGGKFQKTDFIIPETLLVALQSQQPVGCGLPFAYLVFLPRPQAQEHEQTNDANGSIVPHLNFDEIYLDSVFSFLLAAYRTTPSTRKAEAWQ